MTQKEKTSERDLKFSIKFERIVIYVRFIFSGVFINFTFDFFGSYTGGFQ